MNRLLKFWCILVLLGVSTFRLHAGGSGLNVAIIINQNSTNSIQLGNYYREKRNIPPQNVFRIYWPGSNLNWTLSNYNTTLLNPFVSALNSRGLTNQIDYVVLCMDIPYRIDGDNTGNNENSTTSALFYGFMSDDNPPCDLAAGSSNKYSNTEGIFRQTPPISASSNSWLVTMITETNLAMAEQIINQGILGDSTFPTNTVWLGKSDDPDRNVRFMEFDNAVFNSRLHGNPFMRTNLDFGYFGSTLLGYQNGTYFFDILPVPFLVPGGFADSLTSYSGEIFEDTAGATTMLRFLNDGASGSYGTITEPCNYLEKFPDPQDYFFQSRGFSLAECYYMSLVNPYQGLTIGEPLSAPFAQPATGSWVGLSNNAVLSATTNLSIQFTASDALHPVQQIDLFVDGLWFKTVTNIAPAQNNMLSVTINGHNTTYTVPASATIRTVTSNLVTALNNSTYTNLTKMRATLYGDRIELQSGASYTNAGSNITYSAYSTNTSGTLTTFINSSTNTFLDSIAWGYNSYEISGTPGSGSTLQVVVTKTNGTIVTIIATNTPGNTDLPTFTQQFLNLINTNAALTNSDGLAAEDFIGYSSSIVTFNLRALNQGYPAAQIKAVLSASAGMSIIHPGGNTLLIDNISDLRPRADLYVTAGTSNLPLTFPLVTTNFPDGYHELEAVVYEGSHVHTQARATQNVIIQNTPLSATLNTLVGGSNSALEATLQFSVMPNTNAISRVELFSTGGSLGFTNALPANFSVVATNLGLGLHPFYAIVTDAAGHQFRTATTNIRLIGPDSPFPLQIGAPPAFLAWPATAGRSYDVLVYTNISGTFQILTNVVATNTLIQWIDTNSLSPELFYRVRVTP